MMPKGVLRPSQRGAADIGRAGAHAVRGIWSARTRSRIATAVAPEGRGGQHAVLNGLFSRVFSNLVYAQIWEDPVADMQALQITPDDRIAAIASGGCNVMSYLSADPAALMAVDLNAHHLALLRLRLAAAAHLPDHDALVGMFGDAGHASLREHYHRYLRGKLDIRDRHYWESSWSRPRGRLRMLERGLTRHGVLGRFIGLCHRVARLHGVRLPDLSIQPDLDAQRRHFDEAIDPLFDSPLLKVLARQPVMLFGLGIPPAQAALLAGGDDVLPVLRARLRRLACERPLSQNYFAMQAFARTYRGCEPAFMPPYLQARHYETVRRAARRVTTVHDSMTAALSAQPSSSLDIYVLLDAQDWMSPAQRQALWRQIDRTARLGARVLFRTAGRPPGLEADCTRGWRYDAQASERAFEADRSAIYGGVHLYRREARPAGA
ncbi:MAG: BtaA family protein [Burkholderiaceae bacterium]